MGTAPKGLLRNAGLVTWAGAIMSTCGSPQTQESALRPPTSTACTVTVYRSKAEPPMSEFGQIVKGIDTRDASSRQEASFELKSVQGRASIIVCRDK
jgi:hypothetical protein